jgi:hypothetical protein
LKGIDRLGASIDDVDRVPCETESASKYESEGAAKYWASIGLPSGLFETFDATKRYSIRNGSTGD